MEFLLYAQLRVYYIVLYFIIETTMIYLCGYIKEYNQSVPLDSYCISITKHMNTVKVIH